MAIPSKASIEASLLTCNLSKKQIAKLDALFDIDSMKRNRQIRFTKDELSDDNQGWEYFEEVAKYFTSFGYNVIHGKFPQRTGTHRYDYAEWRMIVSMDVIEKPHC